MRIIVLFAFLFALLLSPVLISPGFIANAGDLHLHYYPLKHFTSTEIISGRPPLWNPYIFCGTPNLANPQAGVFYPGNMLFYFFASAAAFKWWTYLHLMLMACFFYGLYKKFVSGSTPAFAGAAVVTMSSVVIYMIPAGHAARLAGFSWLPLSAVLLTAALRVSPAAGGLLRLPSVLFGAAAFFQFLSGHPQGVFMTMLMAAVFAVFRPRSAKYAVVGAAVAAAFSAVQYLPSAEFGALAEKISWRPLARALSLSPRDFYSALVPWRWGNPLDGDASVANTVFFEKKNMFMGYTGLTLAAAGLFLTIKKLSEKSSSSPEKILSRSEFPPSELLAAGAAGLFAAFGFNIPGFGFIYDKMPFLGDFRTPSRFYFLALAAAGFFVSFAVSSLKSYRLRAALAVAAFAELFLWNVRFIRPLDINWGRSPAAAFVGETDRIFTTDEIPANLSMMTRLRNVNGYDALLPASFFRSFYSHYEADKRGAATYLAPSSAGEIYRRDFPGRGLGYILTTEKIRGVRPRAVFGEVMMYKKSAYSPALALPRGAALKSRRESTGKIIFEFAADLEGGPLVVGDNYYPGWRSWAESPRRGEVSPLRAVSPPMVVTEVAVQPGPGGERFVEVPPGARRLIMVFMPGSVIAGALISLAAAAAFLIFIYVKTDEIFPLPNRR